MSLLEKTHQNPGAVTNKLKHISTTIKSDVVMDEINDRMDRYYNTILQMTPVRTGYLKSTVRIANGKDTVQISAGAYYAAIVDRRRHFFMANLVGASADMIEAIKMIYAVGVNLGR